FFFQEEDGIRVRNVTGVQTCALPILEKILQQMPDNQQIKADKILEVNVNHDVFQALEKANENGDTEKVTLYTNLLYQQAKLIEGLPIEDPVAFTNDIC